MTIFLISGQKGTGKAAFAHSLDCDSFDLTAARHSNPLNYPDDLAQAIARNFEPYAITGISTCEEIDFVRSRFSSERITHFHLSLHPPTDPKEARLLARSDFIVTPTAPIKDFLKGRGIE